jgi:hypothetical protein
MILPYFASWLSFFPAATSSKTHGKTDGNIHGNSAEFGGRVPTTEVPFRDRGTHLEKFRERIQSPGDPRGTQR